MKKATIAFLVTLIVLLSATPVLANADDKACWGQASAAYARLGYMGEHASEFTTPRVGLRNLARSLYELEIIEEPTMEALGRFVAEAEGLSIDACMP
jgi:hypothetical protein